MEVCEYARSVPISTNKEHLVSHKLLTQFSVGLASSTTGQSVGRGASSLVAAPFSLTSDWAHVVVGLEKLLIGDGSDGAVQLGDVDSEFFVIAACFVLKNTDGKGFAE